MCKTVCVYTFYTARELAITNCTQAHHHTTTLFRRLTETESNAVCFPPVLKACVRHARLLQRPTGFTRDTHSPHCSVYDSLIMHALNLNENQK